MLLAFAAGRIVRHALLNGHRNAILFALQHSPFVGEGRIDGLVTKDLKAMPKTNYTFNTFDTSTKASSNWLNTNGDDGNVTCLGEERGDDDKEVRHHAGGVHLTVYMRNVDEAFLDSEDLLAQAMVNVVNATDLTILSCHCQHLTPAGVSCIGVLLEKYMSFQTWPREGVIVLDLVVGGTKSILPVLPVIQRHFGLPVPGQVVESKWAHKLRGFDPNLKYEDLDIYFLNEIDPYIKLEVSCFPTGALVVRDSKLIFLCVTISRLHPFRQTFSGSISMTCFSQKGVAVKVWSSTKIRLLTTARTSREIRISFDLIAF
jgi:S-adenosylmethionine/arginine decarboxylase-like enzyme